ncbi:MAG: ribonuclease HII [Leptolinea sp.]|jgi:ribonuclease HII|nr:ribonuclease HII [Leptolinea sp.]
MPRQAVRIAAPAWPDAEFENTLWQSGIKFVAGVDEAGRGAWAGPVTAAAVILPSTCVKLSEILCGVRDSKLMTARQRSKWALVIRQTALAASSGWADVEEIDRLGIFQATRLAMLRAVTGLHLPVDHLLIDAVVLKNIEIPQTNLIKGDARCLSIAAASIIAKTERDHYMEFLEEKYPGYGFARHKGYGTRRHQEALIKIGISSVHRKSYAPVKALLV